MVSATPKKNNPSEACLEAEKCVSNCVAYGRVCPVSARAAGRAACEAVQKLSKGSKVFPAIEEGSCPRVLENVDHWALEDLDIGEKLGHGGFSEVHEVCHKTQQDEKKVLAIKYLKREVMVQKRPFELGASDLAQEGYFLACLDHKHIVRLHAITAGSIETNVTTGCECCLFIVIDRLYDTLEKRIETWKTEEEEHTKQNKRVLGISAEAKEKRHERLLRRLAVALDICSAMQYLHGLNIVYRDLKPDNVGFDHEDVVKMFDFGLAIEAREDQRTKDGKYAMTGKTGSRRYMAPEVANELPYDKSVDVYSFGILLWEMCALEKPFFGYSSGKHHKQVVLGDERPKPDTSWPMELQWLMKRCWSRYPNQRPSFEQVEKSLKEIMASKVDDETFKKPERSRGTSDDSPAPKFANIKRVAKQGRARTWGFPARKQISKDP